MHGSDCSVNVLFNLEIFGIVAQALLEPGVDSSLIALAPKHELLAAMIASNPDFYP